MSCKDERCIECFSCTYPSDEWCEEVEEMLAQNYELHYAIWKVCWGCQYAFWDRSACPYLEEE